MDTIERSVTLPADLETAWTLVTDPLELERWLGDEVALDPTPGAAGRVVERDGTHRALVVDEVAEGRRLSWRWWTDSEPGQPSRVELTLSPTPGGTLLRVVEQLLPTSAPSPRAEARSAATGDAWSHRLLHLESLLLLAAAIRGG